MFRRGSAGRPRRGLRRPRLSEPGLRRAGFRGRVFGLVVLVALVATGATAWLTARTATAQFTESATVQKETADMINRELTGYGADHGTWEGVSRRVQALGERTGQRIRLTTIDGEVIADTDTLNGRTARPPSSRPATVLDPRPQPPAGQPALFPADLRMAKVLMGYRAGIRLAACLTRAGEPVRRETLDGGLWTFTAGASADPRRLRDCSTLGRSSEAEARADQQGALRCVLKARSPAPPATRLPVPAPEPSYAEPSYAEPSYAEPSYAEPSYPAESVPPGKATDGAVAANGKSGPDAFTDQSDPDGDLRRCMEQLFVDRLEAVAPVPLQLKLGFGTAGSRPPTISPGRVLTAAGAVAILVIGATMLLSRRVLAPIAELSRASRRLGAGDLSERVRVHGTDEISELAASFNRMADSLQRSEERQRRMISDIAHELRTPLSNIRGYLEALHDGVLIPEPELFASLHEEAVLQQRLIDDLQELVLAEAGTLPLHRSPLDLAELLETCGAAHGASAAAAGVRLTVETATGGAITPSPPPSVDGDPDRLRQVVGNLVTNAVRATPAGGSVALRAFRDGPDAVVTVRDTGHGIEAEHLQHVFDRFWRADSARGRETGGRGLGLAIAREIVLAHGGSLTAESEVGIGSTFTIRLPAGLPPKP